MRSEEDIRSMYMFLFNKLPTREFDLGYAKGRGSLSAATEWPPALI
jgi:hypothetical protein